MITAALKNRILAICAVSIAMLALCVSVEAGSKGSILFLCSGESRLVDPSNPVDTQYRHELQDMGYDVGRETYPNLTWNTLEHFNTLVIDWASTTNPSYDYNQFISKIPLFNQFLSCGGGILVMYEASYGMAYQSINAFLGSYGASIINEAVVDPTNIWRQPDHLMWYFCHTTNIASHYVTSNVSSLWYLVGPSADGRENYAGTFACNSDWNVLVRGEQTAYSWNVGNGTKTYTSAPPLLAVRNASAGRIALLTLHSTQSTHAGHHVVWQDAFWTTGNRTSQSEGYTLFNNLWQWLSAPSLGNGTLGGYVAPADTPATDPAPWPIKNFATYTAGTTPWKTLVGIHSVYSSGTGTVAEWASAAQAAGYKVIVFAEDLASMNASKWSSLKADCAAVSNADFVAIAGIDYYTTDTSSAASGNRRITYDFIDWLKPEWLTSDGTKVKDSGQLFLSSTDWGGVIETNPSSSAFPAYYAKFYRGLSLYTYSHNTLEESNLQTHLEQARDDYRLNPMVVRRLYSPSEISAISGPNSYLLAANSDEVHSDLKIYSNYKDFVSSGPMLSDWRIDNNWIAPADCNWNANFYTMHIGITSNAGLQEVLIYDGPNLYRRFSASGNTFTKTIIGTHDKQHQFVLIARDVNGGEMVSGSIATGVREHAIYMCNDMQNTLENQWYNHGNTWLSPMGYYDTGWDGGKPGIMVPWQEYMPDGLDIVFNGYTFQTGGYVRTPSVTDFTVARRKTYLGSRDVTVLDNDYDGKYLTGTVLAPTSYLDTDAKYYAWTQREGEASILRVDTTTTIKNTVTLGSTDGSLEIEVFSLDFPSDSFGKYIYTTTSGKTKATRNTSTDVQVNIGPFTKGQYIFLYPDFYGSAGLISLSNNNMVFRLTNAHLGVGYRKSGQTVPANTTYNNSFLLVRDKFGSVDETYMDQIRTYFGLTNNQPAYNPVLSAGTITEAKYPLKLAASNYKTILSTSAASFFEDLPITVSGLNDKWDACIYDMNSFSLLPIGVTDGVGYARLNTANSRKVFIGNTIRADNSDVWISLIKLDLVNPWVSVHNPTTQSITANVYGNVPALEGMSAQVTVGPRATVEVPLTSKTSVADTKSAAVGSATTLNDAVVTAAFPSLGFFFVEDSRRICGLKIVSSAPVEVGDRVSITGTIAVAGGNKQLIADSVSVLLHNCPVPSAIGLNNKVILATRDHSSLLVNSMLVKVWGRVISQSNGIFMLSDGSSEALKVYYSGSQTLNLNNYVFITGVVSADEVGGNSEISIRTRSDSDIVKFQ